VLFMLQWTQSRRRFPSLTYAPLVPPA
jgi:hypothetical protein